MLVLVSCWRITATYDEFWQTWDEPFHLAAGLEWWSQGDYSYERFHPPLARVAIAFLPWMAGLKSDPTAVNHWAEGNEILHAGGNYESNLRFARLGVLPFFILACVVVFLWATRCGGDLAGLCSVFLFVLLTPVLAHAGLATLDMATAATVAAALLAFQWWCDDPDPRRAAVFGALAALAVLTKFSAIAFLGVGIPVLLLLRMLAVPFAGSSRWLACMVVACVSGALTVWAVYRFSFRPVVPVGDGLDVLLQGAGAAADPLKRLVASTPVPAAGFFWGLHDLVVFRRADGHLVYFLGDIGKHGWWSFYPVMLLLKTPLPFLLLLALGVFSEAARWWTRHRASAVSAPLLCGVAVLAAAAVTTPNNGLRQALAVYPLLAIVAGCAFAGIWKSAATSRWRVVPAALLAVWCVAVPVSAHPDYLAYFNPLAGPDPSRVAVDSDLDWGQDLKRLKQFCEQRGISRLTMRYNGTKDIDVSRFGLPPFTELQPGQRPEGWVAISLTPLRRGSGEPPYTQYAWLDEIDPVATAGRSIRLYFLPPE